VAGQFGAVIFKRDVVVTATDIGDCIVDGGWGNNCAVDIAVNDGAEKLLLLGVHPDMEAHLMQERRFKSGEAVDAHQAALDTSAIPFAFEPMNKPGKDVRLPDMVKLAPGSLAALYEEWEWKYFELYQKMCKNPIEKGECYPKTALLGKDGKTGSADDYTCIQEWMEAGYKRAAEVFTPEYVDAWLNS
jgi:hypothetical protein